MKSGSPAREARSRLALGICIDFYLIAQIILDGWVSASLATTLLAVFGVLSFALPRLAPPPRRG